MGVSQGSFGDAELWGDQSPAPRLDVARLTEDLTEPQRLAVTHPGGPLLVVAGAGSGKTRVLTRRVAYLLEVDRVAPWEILAITFTNKAADEMKRRVAELVGSRSERMWVQTFHSACLRLLRSNAGVLGFDPGFTIYDSDESRSEVERIMKDFGIDVKATKPRSVLAAISGAKNAMLSPTAYMEIDADPKRDMIAKVYQRYEDCLRRANAMDFDDLLLNAVRMLQKDQAVRERYQEQFRHVLVDEFQDTNGVQNQLVEILSAHHGNICVVGDADQSIYRFRAADVRNILQFSQRYPDATTILLEENFRSTQTILDAANAVIDRNESRIPKNLFTQRGRGDKIRRYAGEDEYDEGRWVISELRRFRNDYNIEWREMAVFYRTNAQSRVLEEQCIRAGVPYRVISGLRFYDRKEVKDVLAYARLLVNPRDDMAARRVINEPRRGIGAVALTKLQSYATDHNISFAESVNHGEEAGLSGKAASGVRQFAGLLDELRALSNDLTPGIMIETIARESGILNELLADGSDEARGRIENLGELASAAAEYETMMEFLERLALTADSDQLDASAGAVSLMTMHVAKGLEFPAVVITGLEEGMFPHQRALVDQAELEEERRLCYVGITRAMRHLSLTHAWTRTMWGRRKDAITSRFWNEVPEELCEECSVVKPMRRSSFSDVDFGFEGRASDFASGRAFGTGEVQEARTSGADKLGLKVGDRVTHDRFGPGVIIGLSGEGERTRAFVRFDQGQAEKQLVLSISPLQRL